MLQTEKIPNNSSYDQKCELLLKEPEVRFAGIIDKMGNLIAGGLKDGIKPLEDETEIRKMFMEVALRVATRSEFDQSLGEVEYSASRRKKVVVLSFPLGKEILLLSTDKNVDIDKTASKIMKIFAF
jgi:predicted regulator of Ras-like GTPase activity (Roadblock/LC7/MglB family)